MTPPPPRRHSPQRRRFLRRALAATAGLTGVAALPVGYGFYEAAQIRVRRLTVSVPNLPTAFAGTTVAVLADFHHGPFVGLGFIESATKLAQGLGADAIALVGDFAHKGHHVAAQLPPCVEVLSTLTAPLGVFAVPGNHDTGADPGRVYREAFAAHPSLTDLTNRAVILRRGGDELVFAGVDDLWWSKPNLDAALTGVRPNSAVVLLSHNPDYAELKPDGRVGLMLSGHTHGGQVYVPGTRPTWMPSRYGDKYRGGLVSGPMSSVYVTRGLGEAGVPLRLNCPPEVGLLTLAAG